MITRLRIEHYKSIEKVEISLGPLTILVGPNGSGKSNIVDAVRFIRDSVVLGLDRSVADRHGIDSIRQWSPSRPYVVVMRVEVNSSYGHGYLSFSLESKSGTHIVKKEEGYWDSDDSTIPRPRVSYSRNSKGFVEIKSGQDDSRNVEIDRSDELFLSQFEAQPFRFLMSAIGSMEAYSIYPNVLRTPQKPSSDARLYANGENLTSVYKQLASSKKQSHVRARSEILSSMRLIMPSLDSIRIQSLGGLMVPAFRVKESSGKTHDFNVSQISDGTLRMLGLLTALYQPAVPYTLAMEEPEQTINPGVLSILAESIVEVSAKTQMLVTTHSPDFLDKFSDPSVVFSVNMNDGITRAGPIQESQLQAVRDHLFSLGELMAIEGLHS
jgi:predicted ATPase